jgi:glycosyltransferase involved in cell wall biosynthesis
MPPLISIVMPTFNCEDTLERALLSIEGQDYPNLDVILMDGNSTDGTMAVAEQHSSLFSQMISEPDEGQTDALNKGFKLASGDVFCWLNGDDAYAEGALWHVARLFEANSDRNMVIGTSRRVYADGTEEVIPVAHDVLEQIGYRNARQESWMGNITSPWTGTGGTV